MDHDVFISYSSQDMEAAQAICHVLEQNEIRCWMAPRNIPPGSDYGDVIDDAIKSCKVVVIVYSEKAASSPWVTGELNVAFEEQKTIIPFRLDKTPLKGQTRVMLNQRHWIDAYPDYKTKFNDLVKAVALSVGIDAQLDTPPVKPSVQLKKYKKPIIFGLIAAISLGLIIVLYPFIAQQMHICVIDKQGLHVKIKGLSSQQEDALTSILDDMVLVEGGTFVMGNTPEMEDYLTEQDSLSVNPHEVELDNFYICKYEVTQKQWRAFLPTEGKCIKDGDDKAAMDMISWENAKEFADTLSVITGLQFSLPTESQWEYAAKGGAKGRYNGYKYSGGNNLNNVAWIFENSGGSTHEVAKKQPNELGIHDMSGNVWEWCSDWYAPYPEEQVTNPQGSETGNKKVCRGGCWNTKGCNCRISRRKANLPDLRSSFVGFRLAL